MRIGISAQLIKPHPTGVEIYILNLITELLNQDKKNTYYIYCYDNEITGAFQLYDNAVVRTIRGPANKACRVIFEQLVLPLWLRNDKIDVYHASAYVTPLLMPKIKTVVTVPDIFALTHPQYCKWHNSAYYRIVLPKSIKTAHRIIALSDKTKDEIINFASISPDTVTTNYPGVTPLPTSAHSEREPYILYVGNFDPKKNVAFLIKAYETFRQKTGFSHKLILAGEKAWKYHDIHHQSLTSRYVNDIYFLGYIPEEKKWDLYRKASLFVFPSLHEGFGLPPIESAAAGTNVLVPDIPIFRETIPGASFYCLSDIDDCVAQMETLLNSNTRQQIDISRFSWKQHADKCLEIYRELSHE